MKPRIPPKIATWLLEHFGSGRHNESLTGDLVEEYARGRGRLWYWRQVLSVLVASLVRTVQDKLLAGVFVVGYVCCEFAVVMGFLGIADQWHHARSVRDVLSLPIIFNVLALVVLAWFGFKLMSQARKLRRNHRLTVR